jgi:hypothetical protein
VWAAAIGGKVCEVFQAITLGMVVVCGRVVQQAAFIGTDIFSKLTKGCWWGALEGIKALASWVVVAEGDACMFLI